MRSTLPWCKRGACLPPILNLPVSYAPDGLLEPGNPHPGVKPAMFMPFDWRVRAVCERGGNR